MDSQCLRPRAGRPRAARRRSRRPLWTAPDLPARTGLVHARICPVWILPERRHADRGPRVAGLPPAATVGAAALAGCVLVERHRGDNAMLPPRLFRVRQFTAINLVTFFVYAGLSGVTFFLIVELQVVAGFSALAAGISLLPM